LNISNRQIARELGMTRNTAQRITTTLREEISRKTPQPTLSGFVEMDEVYIVAGHKGRPKIVHRIGRHWRRNRLRGAMGRGTLVGEKPPIFWMMQRNGDVVARMLPNVRQVTIEPIIRQFVQVGSIVFTDEYDIYSRLSHLGYFHSTICHSQGEYARDDDGDGYCEVHVNTIEGFWSLLRSWLRPHRGVSQESLPLYLAFFQFVYNSKARGMALLPSLLGLLMS